MTTLAPQEYEITIFRSGKHTDSRGIAREFSDADLQQVVETYNPHHFKAPLIVSHNTGEYSDRALIESELAFGFPERIKKVGSTLKAVFKKISPQFMEWLKSGRILDLSPSFYLPEHPGNPYPGKFSLRHIAGLGKSPPAVKGMNPYSTLSLSEVEEARANLENSWAIDLSEFGLDDEDESVSFSQPVETADFCGMGYAGMAIADLWQNLRDYLIDQESLEVAERVVPTDILRMLRSDAGMDSKPDWMGAYQDLQGQIDSLRSQLNSENTMGYSEGTANFMNTGGLKKALADADMGAIAKATKMSIADLAAIAKGDMEPSEEQTAALMKALGMSSKEKTTSMSEEDLERERAAIAAERQALALARRAMDEEKETSYVESLKGVKPSERPDVVKVLLAIPNGEEMEFSEESGGKRSPRDFVKSLLKRIEPLVDFGEFAPESPTRDRTLSFSAPDGFSVDAGGDKQYKQVLSFCQANNLDPKNPDHITQAMQALEGR